MRPRLMRARLARASEEAAPIESPLLGQSGDNRCSSCRSRPATGWKLREASSDVVCDLCWNLSVDARREHPDERGIMLEDLAGDGSGRVAVFSADGNEMGSLFRSVASFEQQALVSSAISLIFEAIAEAINVPGQKVTLAAGGDDLRVFLGGARALDYAEELIWNVEHELDRVAPLLRLPPEITNKFKNIGLGAGLLIGPKNHPASLLIRHAHWLEDEAKKLCGSRAKVAGQVEYRSALAFAHLRTGDELAAQDGGRRSVGVSRRDGQASEWHTERGRASALLEVPGSQRAALRAHLDEYGDRDRPGAKRDPSTVNYFRYQVARDEKWEGWRGWLRAIGIDWLNADAVAAAIPDALLLELAGILDLHTHLGREPK